METFHQGLRAVGFCCRLGFNVAADKQLLKLLPHEFISIVIADFGGSRVATQPVGMELGCHILGI
jgi:hypothetical protein